MEETKNEEPELVNNVLAESIESPETALDEYYKLKNQYEDIIMTTKKKIMNNTKLSPKEKRREFLKFKPVCINCKRPGGTIFSVKLHNDEDKEYREYKAHCGILADPCNLNITIQTGIYNLLPDTIQQLEDEIKESKNNIIDSKNKLLFGYITTETALQEFDNEKEFVETYTSLLEHYLNIYLKITENAEKIDELKESLESSYEFIRNIQESIKSYNETDNTHYVKDAVDIYITHLQPILRKIMSLKYKQNVVYHDDTTNTYHLIQNKTTIKSLEYASFVDKVIDYDVGLKTKVSKKPLKLKIPVQTINAAPTQPSIKRPQLIIESSDEESEQSEVPEESERLEEPEESEEEND